MDKSKNSYKMEMNLIDEMPGSLSLKIGNKDPVEKEIIVDYKTK